MLVNVQLGEFLVDSSVAERLERSTLSSQGKIKIGTEERIREAFGLFDIQVLPSIVEYVVCCGSAMKPA